ncbi:hypothetical protein HPT29_000170 [Microvirga terrae]|uniref:Uracil-DNA glycosylase n=1 Tax=Microvirga terrae TaxID=2740529 RepID=A0ABY5RUI6_9HYPH|nr:MULTISPECIES: hypothetical protein [Microvirga]MBQ0819869.1 hypothetical protein [Microvirga sp. HBU67558]UVF19614.1 hypothetical protein HPT29_000170 [Microvirga terrae]
MDTIINPADEQFLQLEHTQCVLCQYIGGSPDSRFGFPQMLPVALPRPKAEEEEGDEQ